MKDSQSSSFGAGMIGVFVGAMAAIAAMLMMDTNKREKAAELAKKAKSSLDKTFSQGKTLLDEVSHDVDEAVEKTKRKANR